MAKKAAKTVETVTTRAVVHPEFRVEAHMGDDAITVENAKYSLGWEESDTKTDSSLFQDHLGKYITLRHNNPGNELRFELAHAQKLSQDILNKRWKMNGEAIVIGTTGLVLSGQHRLVGLILAEQKRQKEAHWKDVLGWEGPVTLESVVSYGVDEAIGTVQTLDNVKPRSIADTLANDPELFGKLKQGDRKKVLKTVEYAVRNLWDRTGLRNDAFSPHMTNSEVSDYLGRHPRLKQCVTHILAENKGGALVKYMSPGAASGFMYLMAASYEDGDEYRNMDHPGEKTEEGKTALHLDKKVLNRYGKMMSPWEAAKEFWLRLALGAAGDGGEFKALRDLTRPAPKDSGEKHGGYIFATGEGGGGSAAEKKAAIVRAWNCYSQGHEITPKDVKLEYRLTEDGDWVLVGTYEMGGIDNPAKARAPKAKLPVPTEGTNGEAGETEEGSKEGGEAEETIPTPAELAERMAEIDRNNGRTPTKSPPTPTRRAPGEVPAAEPVKSDAEGKPPAPKVRPPKPIERKVGK